MLKGCNAVNNCEYYFLDDHELNQICGSADIDWGKVNDVANQAGAKAAIGGAACGFVSGLFVSGIGAAPGTVGGMVGGYITGYITTAVQEIQKQQQNNSALPPDTCQELDAQWHG